MNQFDCIGCDSFFSSEKKRNQHYLKCRAYLLKIEPSFVADLSKKKKRARASIQGTYEWALRSYLPKIHQKFFLEFEKKYNRSELEKEVRKLERQINFVGESISEKYLNRQIVVSKALNNKIEIESKLKVEVNLTIDPLEKERKKLAKERRAQAKKNYLGGGGGSWSPFVQGGAPGLGKRS